jgi:hypothetical protein
LRICVRLHGATEKCGEINLGDGSWPVVLVGFQNGGGVYQSFKYKGPDTMDTYKNVRSLTPGAPDGTKGTAGQFGRWPPELPYGPGPGPWPKGYCNLMDDQCKNLGIQDNLCGTCTALSDGGVKLSNVYGLRFNGASFDDNQNGVGSYQAQNICLLAKYGNKGTITNYAKPESYGVTGGGVPAQPHWFGNCRTGYQPYAKCCSNANPLESGQDWNDFSKGNSCQGDGDTDEILKEVNCWFFKSKGIKPGPWPTGMCYPRDDNCKTLDIKDNLCGKCTALPGGFRCGLCVCGCWSE